MVFKNLIWLDGLDLKQQKSIENELIKNACLKSFHKNEVIFNENEACLGVYLIVSGQIKVVTYTYLEKESVINLFNPGDLIGDMIIFTDHPFYPGLGYSISDSKVIFISKSKLISLLSQYPKLAINYIKVISSKGALFSKQAKLLAHKNLQDRIYYYLQTLQKQQNSPIITIPKISQMALILGIPRPSLSRQLKVMVDQRIIKRDNHQIVICQDVKAY